MQVTENRCPGMLISCSKSVNTPGDLHSSFVVFYFVFVLRLPPDVNHGATAFLHLLVKTIVVPACDIVFYVL